LLVDHATPEESIAALGLTPAQIADRVRTAFFTQQLSAVGS